MRACRGTPAIAALLVLAAFFTLAAPSAARRGGPITLRIVGTLDPASGARSLATVEVRIGKEMARQLAVDKIVNQTSGPLGSRILDEAKRYKPAFRLVGDEELIAKLTSAPKGARIAVTGSLTTARNLLLSEVVVEAQRSTTAIPPPSRPGKAAAKTIDRPDGDHFACCAASACGVVATGSSFSGVSWKI